MSSEVHDLGLIDLRAPSTLHIKNLARLRDGGYAYGIADGLRILVARTGEIRVVEYQGPDGTLLDNERIIAIARHEQSRATADEIVAGRIIYDTYARLRDHVQVAVIHATGTIVGHQINVQALLSIITADFPKKKPRPNHFLMWERNVIRLYESRFDKEPPSRRFLTLSRYVADEFESDFSEAMNLWHPRDRIRVEAAGIQMSAREQIVLETITNYLRSRYDTNVDGNTTNGDTNHTSGT